MEKIINDWFMEHIHGSVVARDTQVYNHVHGAVEELKKRLAASTGSDRGSAPVSTKKEV